MKTLLLAPELFMTDSGIPRMLRLYLKALCDLSGEKDRVRFVALNDANIDSSDLRPYSGHALAEWTACNRSKKEFINDALRLSRGVRLIICGHVAQLPVAWFASLLRPGLRYMLVAHGIEVWRPFTFWERRALKGAHRILCVSEFTRRELLKNIRLDDRRLVVLLNALDPRLEPGKDATAISTSQPVILTVSRLSPGDSYKGIDHLIEAMPAILAAAPGTKLRVIGRGDDAHRLQDLAREHKLGAAVEFAGFVSDDQLRHEFARCTLFALPSQKEGFGLVYLEAMASGKPCLAADSGGAPEVVTPDCGGLVPYGDVPAIASACLHMLAKNWNIEKIQACAREFSYPRFQGRLAMILSQ
ncbi:MAG TPA: glycosyltransferase family 4 protein [Rariglobus sp.]|jgi:glycosyltransferase involved in cell wall biosynthesis|nr:glycosyltransferase family 4 protein [Rariglobus sp.]